MKNFAAPEISDQNSIKYSTDYSAMVIFHIMIDVRLIACKARFHLVRTVLLRSY